MKSVIEQAVRELIGDAIQEGEEKLRMYHIGYSPKKGGDAESMDVCEDCLDGFEEKHGEILDKRRAHDASCDDCGYDPEDSEEDD